MAAGDDCRERNPRFKFRILAYQPIDTLSDVAAQWKLQPSEKGITSRTGLRYITG
jgi:hypothetical protein